MINNKTKKISAVNKNMRHSPTGSAAYFLLIALYIIVCPAFSFAEGLDPYSYKNEDALMPYAKPSLLPPILKFDSTKTLSRTRPAPQTPAMVTDADGNVSVYQNGALMLKIDTKGNKTFYMNNLLQYEKDDEDKLTRTYEYSGARATVKNEFGEVLGYKESGQGGLLLKEYDEKNRLTRSYGYNGKMTKMIIDNLTNSRTLFNDKGKAERELNFEGATMATYYYGANGKLSHKIDLYGNKTVYDEMGREQAVYDFTGSKTETYEWLSRNKYKVTTQNGNVSYVDHDRIQYVENYVGFVTERYTWQGTKLISKSYTPTIDDLDNPETTYYENGRPTETKYNGYTIALWKYDAGTGILVAKTEISRPDGMIQTTYYDHGREAFTIGDTDYDFIGMPQGYKPVFYDEVAALSVKYKDSSESIAPYIKELIENYGKKLNVEEVDNQDESGTGNNTDIEENSGNTSAGDNQGNNGGSEDNNGHQIEKQDDENAPHA